MAMHSLRLFGVAGVLLLGGSMAGALAEPIKVGDTMEGVRNARYCEIIPVVRDGFHLKATVYNTLGHNDCPAKIWEGIREDAMKERFSALMVLMNGPRYFIMDEIGASGASASGKTIDVDGMELTERASIDLGLFDLLHRPYRETTIDRDTIYRFKAGSPVSSSREAPRRPAATCMGQRAARQTCSRRRGGRDDLPESRRPAASSAA